MFVIRYLDHFTWSRHGILNLQTFVYSGMIYKLDNVGKMEYFKRWPSPMVKMKAKVWTVQVPHSTMISIQTCFLLDKSVTQPHIRPVGFQLHVRRYFIKAFCTVSERWSSQEENHSFQRTMKGKNNNKRAHQNCLLRRQKKSYFQAVTGQNGAKAVVSLAKKEKLSRILSFVHCGWTEKRHKEMSKRRRSRK